MTLASKDGKLLSFVSFSSSACLKFCLLIYGDPTSTTLRILRNHRKVTGVFEVTEKVGLANVFSLIREKLIQAYEFALSHIGLDPCSGGIWLEYCSFVKSG